MAEDAAPARAGGMTQATGPRRLALGDLPALVGTPLGQSGWHDITQDRIDAFAEATGDRAWIHVDPARAATGPFGGTIAHGFFTLSLIPVLTGEIFTITDAAALVNYGVNRARFPAPLRVGARVRMSTTLAGLEESPAGPRLVLGFEMVADSGGRPVAVGETVLLATRGAAHD